MQWTKMFSLVAVAALMAMAFVGASSAMAENGPAEIQVLKEGHESAKITGEGLVHAVCGGSLDCSYNGVGLVGTVKGPLLSTAANGEVTLNKVTTNKEAGGFLCPATSKLDLNTTPLSATYIGGEKMGCLKVGPNRGLYLGAGNGQTCEVHSPGINGEYELAKVLPNIGAGKMACGSVSAGRFLGFGNGVTCQVEDGTRVGIFELGTTP